MNKIDLENLNLDNNKMGPRTAHLAPNFIYIMNWKWGEEENWEVEYLNLPVRLV